ncbi:MAG: hypothetical protein P0S94_04600 [Simkaniaceae bacterium]|nr:hypothetical protein [Simkaniaceae bacterium]
MSFTKQDAPGAKSNKELEDVISKAIKKVGGRKENDLCKYIPVNTGGYMHHFTLKKMKSKDPSELSTMIEKFIIKPTKPSVVAPKQRAARGSRKKRDAMQFSRTQLDRLLNMARLAGDHEMISVLSPRKSVATAKRELIAAVRKGDVNHELWNSYVEAISAHKILTEAITGQKID